MSYWKATEATISEDGLSITLSFQDQHSCSWMSSTLPAEEWLRIHEYRAAFEEPYRRIEGATRRLLDYLSIEAERQIKKKE